MLLKIFFVRCLHIKVCFFLRRQIWFQISFSRVFFFFNYLCVCAASLCSTTYLNIFFLLV